MIETLFWVLGRAASIRQFFWACVRIGGIKNFTNIYKLKRLLFYLINWSSIFLLVNENIICCGYLRELFPWMVLLRTQSRFQNLWMRELSQFQIKEKKSMLWVLGRADSVRRFFWAPKQVLKLMGGRVFSVLLQKILLVFAFAWTKIWVSYLWRKTYVVGAWGNRPYESILWAPKACVKVGRRERFPIF